MLHLNASYSSCFCLKAALWPVNVLISFSVYRDCQSKDTACKCQLSPERWLTPSWEGIFWEEAHARQFYLPEFRTLQHCLDLLHAFWSNTVHCCFSSRQYATKYRKAGEVFQNLLRELHNTIHKCFFKLHLPWSQKPRVRYVFAWVCFQMLYRQKKSFLGLINNRSEMSFSNLSDHVSRVPVT